MKNKSSIIGWAGIVVSVIGLFFASARLCGCSLFVPEGKMTMEVSDVPAE